MYKQIDLFQFLREVENEMPKKDKIVQIEDVVNIKALCDYVVTCSYKDIVMIICMLHDYVKMLDEISSGNHWLAYYREKLIKMADRLSEQIEYDYDAAMEKYRKKLGQKETSSDVGADTMLLVTKYKK